MNSQPHNPSVKPALSLYIHVPWCEKKCPYCDFNSHLSSTKVDEAAYVSCLLADLDDDLAQYAADIDGRKITTVFIGGGTPSLFGAQSYELLFKGLRDRIEFADDAEITLEANPGSSEIKKFAGFRQAGINRLSIGVQSFNQSHLLALGRVHDSREALNAAKYARQAGFDNFNLDIMFGLPGQSLEQSLQDVQQAIALKSTHLSCYQLTIEPNTLFHHSPPITPGDELLWDMQEQLQAELSNSGFRQYEVSAYSLTGRQCQHNLNYWQFGDYLGIGAGAHSKLTQQNGKVVRAWKIKHPASYIKRANRVGGVNTVKRQQVPFEFMMNALRLNEGYDIESFNQRTGVNIDEIEPLLSKHEQQGLVERTQQRIKPTEFGHNMLNNMLEDFLSYEF